MKKPIGFAKMVGMLTFRLQQARMDRDKAAKRLETPMGPETKKDASERYRYRAGKAEGLKIALKILKRYDGHRHPVEVSQDETFRQRMIDEAMDKLGDTRDIR